MSNDSNDAILNLSEGSREELEGCIKEAAGSLLRAESERDLRKEIAKRVKENFDIGPANFNKLVKMFHAQNKEEVQAQTDMLVSMYETVFSE